MAVDDIVVIDALALAIDYGHKARASSRLLQGMADKDVKIIQGVMPPEYVQDHAQYYDRFPVDALISALFAESPVDLACFHSALLYGGEYSPLAAGVEMRRQWPDRVFVYGAISPFHGVEAALEDLERQVAEDHIDGLGLRPWDTIDGRPRSFSMADEKTIYPILQRCLDLGVKVVAPHKGLPEGLAPMDPYRVGDVDYCARDFPDLAFEVVHSGFAYVEEAALQVARFPNVWVNLEATMLHAIKPKPKFAQILGEFLLAGGEDRLLFGSGCSACHPRPIIEAFLDFTMPAEMVEGGYPDLTREIKKKILGENFARLHGIDLQARRAAIADDAIEREKRANGLKAAWSGATR